MICCPDNNDLFDQMLVNIGGNIVFDIKKYMNVITLDFSRDGTGTKC